MNFKRVLVLVMALVMVASVCAPSILAAGNTETKHDHLEDVLNNSELLEKYEEVKVKVEEIAKDIEENHEEYYAIGFAYANENGYISGAIGALKLTLETLPQINLEDAPVTDEMRADLQTELDALAPTIEKLLAILESGEASDFDGFVNAALTLEGDLYTHLNNIYAILEQGSIELNQFVLVPAFNQLMKVLEEEVLPALDTAIEAYVDAVVEHVTEVLAPYYEKALEVYGIARDTYELVVETLVKIDLFVGNAIDTYHKMVETILQVKGDVEDAIRFAAEVYNKVDETIGLLVKVFGNFDEAVEAYNRVVVYINGKLDQAENAFDFVTSVYKDVVEFIDNLPENAHRLRKYLIAEITSYVVGIINDARNLLEEEHYDATNGSYELKDDSFYLALGNSPYADELALMLNLGGKKHQADLRSDYLNLLPSADLITVNVDNGEFVNFAIGQTSGVIGELIRSNEKLMDFYHHPYIGGYVQSVIADAGIDVYAEVEELDWDKYLSAEEQEMLEAALGLIRSELVERGLPEQYSIDLQPMVQKALEETGLAGFPGFSIELGTIDVPVADIAVFGIESALYAYARFVADFGALVDNINELAPGATVVLLGIANPLEGLDVDFADFGIDCITFADCYEAADIVTDTLNAQLYSTAIANDNIIYIANPNADAYTIYEAIHVHCEHIYENCVDTTCDRCLMIRLAPGHLYGNYTFNHDSTCSTLGTETGSCIYCGELNTRTAANSKLPHNWAPATCTAPKTCKDCGATSGSTAPHDYAPATCTEPKTCRDCGATSGSTAPHDYMPATCTKPKTCKDCGATSGSTAPHTYSKATCTEPRTCEKCGYKYGEPNGHDFSEWNVLEKATYFGAGKQEHTCRVCGLVEREVIPQIQPKYPMSTIVTVIISAVIFACAVSAFILWRLRKVDILK